MSRNEREAVRLLASIMTTGPDQATMAVLQAAMERAVDVTHECGTPEATDAAILDTFRAAVWEASRWSSGLVK